MQGLHDFQRELESVLTSFGHRIVLLKSNATGGDTIRIGVGLMPYCVISNDLRQGGLHLKDYNHRVGDCVSMPQTNGFTLCVYTYSSEHDPLAPKGNEIGYVIIEIKIENIRVPIPKDEIRATVNTVFSLMKHGVVIERND